MERGNQKLKLVDRYVGIPLIWLLGKLRPRNRKLPANLQRIAIVKGAAIGDTVLLSAIVQDIRAQFPTADLLFFCGQTCVETAKYIPGLTEVIFIPTTRPWKTIRTLRSWGHFDLVIDAGPWTRLEALFTYFMKGSYKIGFRSIDQYRHYGYDLAVDHSNQQHEIDNNRNLIRPFISRPDHKPVLGLPDIDPALVLEKAGLTKPFWILHAWSGGYKGQYKEWRTDRWVEVAGWLVEQGYQVAFSGAKADKEETSKLVEACQQQGISVVNLAGQTSLAEMMTLIHLSAGVISVNTGIMHIAAALGASVVALNGPVPTLRWGAVSDKAVNIDARGSEPGYIHLGFEYPALPPDCMGSITVQDVLNAIRTLTAGQSKLVFHPN